jgi:predicted ATPase
MIFAISGSQGCGKTTVLQELKNRGYNVVERKTARSILDDWEVTLDEVNTDLHLKMKFQEELFQRKLSDDLQHVDDTEIWFTERTFVDLFGYTVLNIGQYNQCSEFLDQYHFVVAKAQNHLDGVFYLLGGLFDIKEDGVRSINEHYSTAVDLTFRHFTQTMSSCPVYEMEMKDLTKRVDFIEQKALKLARAAHGVYQ